jgi:uncharacterized protein YndB with AHSA1/START domain
MHAAVDARSIERELLIEARPETVWSLLVEPSEMVRWMGCAGTVDVRPGGEYRVEVIPGHVARGSYVEIDPPRRLVYTWGWEGSEGVPPGSTTLVFELEPRGRATLLRFRHRDLPTEGAVTSHTHGWEHYLERLLVAGSGADPGRDPWRDRPPFQEAT